MYRQIFVPTIDNLIITIPKSWYGKKIEVLAFPVNETFNVPLKEDTILENRKKREENSKKHSVSFSSLGYKFNREEANNYDE